MKIVYSYYVLDIIHRGHLYYLANAKRLAGEDGISIVGVLTDAATMENKRKPIISFEERMTVALALQDADLVVPQESYSPLSNLKIINPDILIESASHSPNKNVEEYMGSIGGIIVTLPYYPNQSSTLIKETILGQ